MKQQQNLHKPADALDWNEAMKLINALVKDNRYRDSMLIASGCFLGLRISDLLTLHWSDLISEENSFVLIERKTGKQRSLGVNPKLKSHAQLCMEHCSNPDIDQDLIFPSIRNGFVSPLTRCWAWQLLKEIKKTYNIKSARQFSTHSLRKTFGRRIWLQECKRGRGEQALVLLQEIFGHTSIAITKRYLGIRQEEILSVYNSLDL